MFSDRNLLLLALVVTAITLGLSNGSWAADVSWDGGGDGSTWNDNQNWAGDNGPGDGDDRGILGDTAVDRTVVRAILLAKEDLAGLLVSSLRRPLRVRLVQRSARCGDR